MFDPTQNLKLLKVMSLVDRGLAFLQRHNAGVGDADRQLDDFYGNVWREAAAAVGADIESLGQGVFEIRKGNARTWVLENSTPLDDLATHCIVRTKSIMYARLAKHGLPVPRHLTFKIRDMGPARDFIEQIGHECVVKPAGGTGGGKGVTTGIRTRWQLARAAYRAGATGREVLIEEQVEGDNYRLLYLDGKLEDAVLRRPPSATADGHSSVRQLVGNVNRDRLAQRQLSHGLLSIDLDMERTLARQGYTLASVPPAGTVVVLKTAINQNSNLDNLSASGTLCDDIIEAGARAAGLAGVRLAGVDIITRDPGKPLEQSGGVFLEVNSPPGYFWHYHKKDGAFPLGVHVLERLLAEAKPGPPLRT
jgi:D-alanine-D-alanine ligase-like ATP-grasp enzyme